MPCLLSPHFFVIDAHHWNASAAIQQLEVDPRRYLLLNLALFREGGLQPWVEYLWQFPSGIVKADGQEPPDSSSSPELNVALLMAAYNQPTAGDQYQTSERPASCWIPFQHQYVHNLVIKFEPIFSLVLPLHLSLHCLGCSY